MLEIRINADINIGITKKNRTLVIACNFLPIEVGTPVA